MSWAELRKADISWKEAEKSWDDLKIAKKLWEDIPVQTDCLMQRRQHTVPQQNPQNRSFPQIHAYCINLIVTNPYKSIKPHLDAAGAIFFHCAKSDAVAKSTTVKTPATPQEKSPCLLSPTFYQASLRASLHLQRDMGLRVLQWPKICSFIVHTFVVTKKKTSLKFYWCVCLIMFDPSFQELLRTRRTSISHSLWPHMAPMSPLGRGWISPQEKLKMEMREKKMKADGQPLSSRCSDIFLT